MDLRRLREETRPEHEATEALLPLTDPALTLPEYTAALRRLRPLLESWEAWSEAHAPAAVGPLLRARRRSAWIRQDLEALEGPGSGEGERISGGETDWDAIVRDADGRDYEGAETIGQERAFAASFLGAWYVVEGSTLGGRFIARHVEERLGLTPQTGSAYFRGHGDATGPLWRETTAAIAQVPEAEAPLVIAAAKRTFLAFQTGLAPERVFESAHG